MRHLNDRGMTLVEVLVSIALITVCAIPLLQLLTAGALSTDQGSEYSIATTLLGTTMEELRAGLFDTQLKNETQPPAGHLLATVATHPSHERRLFVSSGPSGLKQVRLQISWTSRSGRRSIEATTLINMQGR